MRFGMPTKNNSNTVAAAVPVLAPNITRLHTPPISELSNAGSTIARKDRASELSAFVTDVSDTEESASPTTNRSSLKINVPVVPLTKRNLAKCQEEITSAVEIASEYEQSPPPATSNTRLIQARNFLLTENTNSYPGFATRLEEIEEFLREVPPEMENSHPSIYNEVEDLLRSHRIHVIAGGQPPIQRRPPISNLEDASRPVMSLPAEHDDQADPFEWTNRLHDLTHGFKHSPAGGKKAFAVTDLTELARPLNGGRLPSAQEACRLINERMIREHHENKPRNDIDHDQLWAFEKNLPPQSKEKKFSLDRWSGHPPKGETAPTLELGEGRLMPQEMMDIDWHRDRSALEDNLRDREEGEEAHNGDAQLLLAETPLLQKLMSEQIESDLEPRIKKGRNGEPRQAKQALLMTQKFVLPRPSRERIIEAAEIAKSLNIQLDPPTLSPGMTLLRKRKFEPDSGSESEDQEGGARRVDSIVDKSGRRQGKRVIVDESDESLDDLLCAEAGAYPEMLGALRDQEGSEDGAYVYTDE